MRVNIKKLLFRTKIALPVFLFFVVSLFSTLALLDFEKGKNDQFLNVFDAFWWSIVTMSTTGYGDKVPFTLAGKIVALFTIISGVLITSLLTGTIASVYLNQLSRSRSGLMDFKKVKGHIVICGWRGDMIPFLLSILSKEHLSIEKIIVVADVMQEKIDKVFEVKELEGFQFVRGAFYQKEVLIRANAKHARKAIVLADGTNAKSDFEIDSQTVMTVISLKTLSKHIHVSAQLLERNFEMYLQRAKCDEIMYAKWLNTEMLSMAVRQEGMSNVLLALIGLDENNCEIYLENIKHSLVGKTYTELKDHYTQTAKQIIGVLENTGQLNQIVDQAIRSAQKTADFPKMLHNLRQVQKIKPFKPRLLPADDYEIPEYSVAIVLRRTHEKE